MLQKGNKLSTNKTLTQSLNYLVKNLRNYWLLRQQSLLLKLLTV
jgi:hypothetical protein